jgi:hypothetical protein
VPSCLADAGIRRVSFDASLEKLVDDAANDTSVVAAARVPSYEELERLFVCTYEGREVDF